MVRGKSGPKRARLDVPASTTRSSRSSSRASSSALATARTVSRSAGSNRSASPESRADASRKGREATSEFSSDRSRATNDSPAWLTRSLSVPTIRCSTRPVLTMTTTISRSEPSGDQLDVAHGGPGQARVLHDGDLAGQRREQAHRPVDDVVEVDRAGEEGADGGLLRGGHRLDRAEPVDEEPVARVGRDPARGGVRRMDQPLLLEDGHVVADRGRRDAQVVAFDEGLGPDRLRGLDVVLDDGAQHGEPTLLAHDATSSAWLADRFRSPQRLAGTPGARVPVPAKSTSSAPTAPGASHTGAGRRVPTLPAWTGTERTSWTATGVAGADPAPAPRRPRRTGPRGRGRRHRLVRRGGPGREGRRYARGAPRGPARAHPGLPTGAGLPRRRSSRSC